LYSVVVSFFVLLLLFFIFIFSILDFCVIQACFCQFCYVLNLPSFAIMMSQIYLSISILIPTEAGLSILFSLIITYSGNTLRTVSIYHTIFCFDIYPRSELVMLCWCVCWNIRGIRKRKLSATPRARARVLGSCLLWFIWKHRMCFS